MGLSGLNQWKEKDPLSLFLFLSTRVNVFLLLVLLSISSHGQQKQRNQEEDSVFSYQYKLPSGADPSTISFSKPVVYTFLNESGTIIQIDSTAELPLVIYYDLPSHMVYRYPGVRQITQYEPTKTNRLELVDRQDQKQENNLLNSYPELYKVGSISRGITVGNNQNLFVNSTLNLQLQGKIGDDLYLNAAITDQNIPFQPEGNTQQIRDFDNVLIEMIAGKTRIAAGDIVLSSKKKPGYFLQYYKNIQGLLLEDIRPVGQNFKLNSQLSFGIAKGRFNSARLDPVEGMQGPYRLRGQANERFIFILANSEKVYLDGKLLKRGFDEDYIIDYNLAEITFTSQVVITRFSRIRVDYEYGNQNYLRTNSLISEELVSQKGRYYLNYFSAQDRAENAINYTLTPELRSLLSEAGDPVNSEIEYENNTLIENSQGGNFYQKKDTLIDDMAYTIFEYTTVGDSLFQVSFTETGSGNYMIADQNGYGRIYSFIAPENGIAQGRYEPVVKIITPQSQSLLVLGSENKIGSKISFKNELAISKEDENSASSIDDANNAGIGWKAGLLFTPIDKEHLKIESEVEGEYNSRNFRPIDRFRSIEFDRDWNYPFPFDSLAQSERMLRSSIKLISKNHKVSYNNIYRHRISVLEGWQHFLENEHKVGALNYRGRHFLMTNRQQDNIAEWTKSYSELFLDIKGYETGIFYDLDQNTVSSNDSNRNVMRSAMYYNEQGLFMRTTAQNRVWLGGRYSTRIDKRPTEGSLQRYTDARQAVFDVGWDIDEQNSISVLGTYRDTRRVDTIDRPNEEIIQGSLVAKNSIFKGHIVSQLNYMTQNSRELSREYIYSQVGAGQGTHTWRDENNNGIAELSEFYEAINQDEKNYIRLFVPTDEYINAYSVIYQHTINWKMPDVFNRSLLKPLSKVTGLLNWNITQKSSIDDVIDRANPFVSIPDSMLLMKRSFVNYAVFYNRFNTGLGFSWNHRIRDQKQLNTNGFESDDRQNNELAIKYNFSNKIQMSTQTLFEAHSHETDFLDNRTFRLNNRQLISSVSWMPGLQSRLEAKYSVRDKQNTLVEDSFENAQTQEWEIGTTLIHPGKRNINIKFSYLKIAFEGIENSFLGYQLLEGLRPGDNFRMNVNINQTLRNGLQLNLSYFGRKSEMQKVIHSGSVNLTAFF